MKHHLSRPGLVFGAVSLFVLSLGVASASANTITFQLTSDHCGSTVNPGGCIAVDGASAGTVTITDGVAGVVNVSVNLGSAYKFVHTGFDADFGFNLSSNPAITYSSVSAGFTQIGTNPVSAGSLHMDGTGFFEYGVVCTACGTGGSNPQTGPLTFTITGSGLSTSSFEQNAVGEYFAVDLIGNGNTGAVDASTPSTSVPDGGSTAALLGSVLLAVGMLRRRFGQN